MVWSLQNAEVREEGMFLIGHHALLFIEAVQAR